jgi:hypothetical protein
MITKQQLKNILLQQIQEDVEIHLPYAVEFNRYYLESLLQLYLKVAALIQLENLTQVDINASIPNGTSVKDLVLLAASKKHD